jgi:ribosomal protein S27E
VIILIAFIAKALTNFKDEQMNIHEELEKIRKAAAIFRVPDDEDQDGEDDEFVNFVEDVNRWLTELANIKENEITLVGATCTNCGRVMTARGEIFMAYDDGLGSGKKGVCVGCAEKEPERLCAESCNIVKQAMNGEFDSVEITCEGCGANDVVVPPSNPKRVRCGHCGRTIEIG